MQKNKLVLLIILILLAAGGGGYFYFNKPMVDGGTNATATVEAGSEATKDVPLPDPGDLTPAENAPQPTADDIYLGNADAPITIIEYFSLSCPHCAHFHKDVLPLLKKDYIDTGKVRFIYRDFPLNKPALAAAILARCQSPVNYPAMVDYLFETADQWLVEQPLPALTQIAKTAGVDEAVFKQCIEDPALREKVINSRKEADEKYGINSTPTFYINGVKINGTQAYEKYQAVIEALLKKKG